MSTFLSDDENKYFCYSIISRISLTGDRSSDIDVATLPLYAPIDHLRHYIIFDYESDNHTLLGSQRLRIQIDLLLSTRQLPSPNTLLQNITLPFL